MSISSATETFTDGAEIFDQEKYHSTVTTSFEPDLNRIEETFQRPLKERITPLHSHHKSAYGEYRLDDVVVRCPSEAFRKYQKEQWETVKQGAEKEYWGWTTTLVGSVCAAGVGGFLAAHANPFGPYIFVAGAVLSIASAVFVFRANSSCSKANDQIHQWEADPVVKVGQARNDAHDKGFPHIYANRLKLGHGPSTTALFHPLQVEYEYKKYFNAFCRKLLEQHNPALNFWMSLFRSCNPLSETYMAYGLGYIPEHMKAVLEDYSRFESFLSDISNSYEKMKAGVRKTASERIEANNKTRNEQLQQLAKDRDSDTAKAETARDKILRDPHASLQQRQDALAAFNAAKDIYQNIYNRSSAPINKKYEGKNKEIEKERDEQIKKLDEQKNNQLGNNYRAAHELLQRAKHAWDNKGYRPVNFQQYFPFPTAQPAQPGWFNQQPIYYQQPVYPQQPAPQPYPQQQAPQYGHSGQFGYGYAAPIPAHQQYYYGKS